MSRPSFTLYITRSTAYCGTSNRRLTESLESRGVPTARNCSLTPNLLRLRGAVPEGCVHISRPRMHPRDPKLSYPSMVWAATSWFVRPPPRRSSADVLESLRRHPTICLPRQMSSLGVASCSIPAYSQSISILGAWPSRQLPTLLSHITRPIPRLQGSPLTHACTLQGCISRWERIWITIRVVMTRASA